MHLPRSTKTSDAESLIQLHERLLFLRAYPANARVLRRVEKLLKSFSKRIDRLENSDKDVSALDEPEVSGIAGRSVTSNFSYAIVRWLASKFPHQLSIDWDWFEEEERFGATMPRFLPLLEDDAMVEAHVPYRQWLRAAKGSKNEVAWIIAAFESLNFSNRRKAELYDSLKLHITWRFGSRSSRTGMKLPVRQVFFHSQPLIKRRDVSLRAELQSPAIRLKKVSRAQGERILNLAREASVVRYRELHGFTYGHSRRVIKAHLGRGTDAFIIGVPPENRLPLRAYHAAIIFKNGVAVGYFEGLSLAERMESGFNLYYTFRDGETAWLYARILRLMRQLLGVTVFSIDPYQVGHENEEGIESGAFWFYRKLGFRPVTAEIVKLTEAEEKKMAKNRGYRSSAATLRRLAAGQMIFELFPANTKGAWDDFAARNIGLAVQRRMARDFDGHASGIREASVARVKRMLGLQTSSWTMSEHDALINLALPLAMISDLDRWTAGEKALASRIVRAKAAADEAQYLRLVQQHAKLRAALIQFGCGS